MKFPGRASRSLEVGRQFWPELRAHRSRLFGVVLVFLSVTALELLRPWPIQWIFDGALAPTGDSGRSVAFVVWTGASAYMLIALVKSALQYTCRLQLASVGHAVTRSLRYRIFSHLASLSPTFHSRHKSGDILVRFMGDVPILRTMLVDSTVELLSRFLMIAGVVGVMLWVDPLLALVVWSIIPALVLIVRLISMRITIATRKQRRKEGDLADFLHEAIGAVPLIQSLGRSKDTVRRFARSNRTSARAGLKTARLGARLSATVESMLGVTVAGTLAFGSFRVVTGELTPGELLVFLSYVRSLLKPVRSASKHGEKIAKGTACGERILEVLDEDIPVRSRPGAPKAPAHPRTLEFRDVSFRYGDEEGALRGFTTSFARGELIGLFGASGCGKSTVAALATRLHDPDGGSIRVDGTDVRELELDSLRESIGLCLQETVLFGDSIRENLLLGRPDATDEELWEACRGAGAEPFLLELEDGLDTRLGAGGSGVSGGERRRLSLARTLLRASSILIVDEPFAGLDRRAVDAVRATLDRAARDRIVVIIAHDLDNLEAFDRIVFMEQGRVIAEGTNAELMLGEPRYRNVVRAVQEVTT